MGARPIDFISSSARTINSFLSDSDATEGPITTQPALSLAQANQILTAPVTINLASYQPGLEYLKTVKELIVKQSVSLVKAFTGCEMNNRFIIYNELNQKVYTALEKNDCCTRNVCGQSRPFELKIYDNCCNEIIYMYRRLACSRWCFPCCLQSMKVFAPPGNFVGTIEQEWGICSSSFRIRDHSGELTLRIESPFCMFSLCGSINFEVVSRDDEHVGKISKKWPGCVREYCADADLFGIEFPLDLDVRMKAVLLGATFLIDIMFFGKGNPIFNYKNLIIPYCMMK